MSFNQIIVCGNLGRDPEIRQTDKTKIANFTVATNKRIGSESKTTWFRCVAFGKLADFVETYFTKGAPIYLTGELSQSEWKDRDGNSKTTLEINVRDIQFLPKVSPGERYEDETIGIEAERSYQPVGDSSAIPF